jgi:hypothetical protein
MTVIQRFRFPLLLLSLFLLAAPVAAQNDPATPSRAAQPTGDKVTIPEGTTVQLELVTPINTKMNQVGDEVVAQLKDSLRIDGKLVLPRGTEFRGTITEINPAKVGQRAANLKIAFDTAVTDLGTQSITTLVVSADDYRHEARLKADQDGRLKGGHSGDRTANNAVRGGWLGGIGAGVIGRGGGGAGVLLTKGNDINLQQNTIIRIKFSKPTTISL